MKYKHYIGNLVRPFRNMQEENVTVSSELIDAGEAEDGVGDMDADTGVSVPPLLESDPDWKPCA